jgi:enoyl-CoA hydratase
VTSNHFECLDYQEFDSGEIVRITLNRPAKRNAQNRELLLELDDAFRAAEQDDQVKVVILNGAGPMFSAGHDLSGNRPEAGAATDDPLHPSRTINGGTRSGAERQMLQEWHYFYQNTLRWRNLRKITIAQVHGKALAAGLMLMWACDLIVAAEGTEFADVVGARLGMCGVEYFGHPWEFGPRKAKELLLTGDSISAEDALGLGMVSKIFPAAELDDQTLAFARRIARLPTMTALLIKESVNQTVDNMGFYNSLQACFTLHELNHSYWRELNGGALSHGTPEFGVPDWRQAPGITPSDPRSVGPQ